MMTFITVTSASPGSIFHIGKRSFAVRSIGRTFAPSISTGSALKKPVSRRTAIFSMWPG